VEVSSTRRIMRGETIGVIAMVDHHRDLARIWIQILHRRLHIIVPHKLRDLNDASPVRGGHRAVG